MSTRLPHGGRLIDRSQQITFHFDGKPLKGFVGDTLASALLGQDQMLMGRSFKYHRPRGPVASGPEEPNALFNLGKGADFEPNARATTTDLYDGLQAESQNRWPSLHFDIGAINARLGRFLPAGFYYKMFLHPRAFWKHIYEPFIRRMAGLGRAPKGMDQDHYEHFYHHCEVMVIGGGIAGLAAALTAAKSGVRVLLVEQTAHWGGRAPVDGTTIDGTPAGDWIEATVKTLTDLPNVTLRRRTMGAGVYDHGYVLAHERVADHTPNTGKPRHRLWRVRTQQIITATGAIERPLSFAGNDIPGVMLASAMRDYMVNYGVSIGDRTVVVTNNDDAYRTALTIQDAGLDVPAIIDARPEGGGALMEAAKARGIRVETGKAIAKVGGGQRVTGVTMCSQAGEGGVLDEIPCDAVAMSGGWSPVVHLWSHCGGKLIWDDAAAMFRPDPTKPPLGADGAGFVSAAGSADGVLDTSGILANAQTVAIQVAKAAGGKAVRKKTMKGADPAENPIAPVWMMPQGAPYKLRAKAWLDFQNDVKVSDVQLAAQEGFESVEHAKRYTTLGMATDQGKLSNINGLAILSQALNTDIPHVGTTTFRPPYQPISMASLAGGGTGGIIPTDPTDSPA